MKCQRCGKNFELLADKRVHCDCGIQLPRFNLAGEEWVWDERLNECRKVNNQGERLSLIDWSILKLVEKAIQKGTFKNGDFGIYFPEESEDNKQGE